MRKCLLANEAYYNSVTKRDNYKSAFILGTGTLKPKLNYTYLLNILTNGFHIDTVLR